MALWLFVSMTVSLCFALRVLCSVLCALCSVLCALCSGLCALCSVLCALCSLLCALCSVLSLNSLAKAMKLGELSSEASRAGIHVAAAAAAA